MTDIEAQQPATAMTDNQAQTKKSLIYIAIDVARHVFRNLGSGLSETLYRNAMCIELRRDSDVDCDYSSPVYYYGPDRYGSDHSKQFIGMIRADLIVDRFLCIEVKCKQSLTDTDMIQAAKYKRHIEDVKATIIMNFTPHGVQYQEVN